MPSPSIFDGSKPVPSVFDRCFAALMVNEVCADPLDPHCWSGGAVGAGVFVAPRDGLDMNVQDGGNWTGGIMGVGVLGGTRWGIDTASYQDALAFLPAELRPGYPVLVRDLSIDQARVLTRYAYWDRVCGDQLPPRLALLVNDAAFNAGVGMAGRWLQAAVGAAMDGKVGAKTLEALGFAIAAHGLDAIAAEVHAQRMLHMAGLAAWQTFGLGWARRLARLLFQAASLPA